MKTILFLVLVWSNGQAGNATTNLPAECADPPYSTHDWIADRALAMQPTHYWLNQYRIMFLLGTEAPDNDKIPEECGAPHTGYDDRRRGHSVDWNDSHTKMTNSKAAVRSMEEYNKAKLAYDSGNLTAAAFYLGAMAHYIGDVAQYGHTYPDENNHSNYEGWVGRRTKEFNSEFEQYLTPDGLDHTDPYTAVSIISKATSAGQGKILPAEEMDSLYKTRPKKYVDSVGASLDLAVNTLADVLHSFR